MRCVWGKLLNNEHVCRAGDIECAGGPVDGDSDGAGGGHDGAVEVVPTDVVGFYDNVGGACCCGVVVADAEDGVVEPGEGNCSPAVGTCRVHGLAGGAGEEIFGERSVGEVWGVGGGEVRGGEGAEVVFAEDAESAVDRGGGIPAFDGGGGGGMPSGAGKAVCNMARAVARSGMSPWKMALTTAAWP